MCRTSSETVLYVFSINISFFIKQTYIRVPIPTNRVPPHVSHSRFASPYERPATHRVVLNAGPVGRCVPAAVSAVLALAEPNVIAVPALPDQALSAGARRRPGVLRAARLLPLEPRLVAARAAGTARRRRLLAPLLEARLLVLAAAMRALRGGGHLVRLAAASGLLLGGPAARLARLRPTAHRPPPAAAAAAAWVTARTACWAGVQPSVRDKIPERFFYFGLIASFVYITKLWT